MKNSWLHRSAVVAAVLAFVVIGFGAYLTSTIRPLPGPNPGPVGTAPVLYQMHIVLAGVLALLTLGLAIWFSRMSGWIMCGAVIVESVLGFLAAPVLHAILAPLVFSSFVAIALFTSESWSQPPVPVPDLWPPLRNLSILAPVFLVLQISLGAGFRHNALGVWWHILNAMIVLLLIMVLGVCVLRQFPEHPTLRPAAVALLVITGIQVLLGFGVYMVVLIVSQNNLTLIISGMLHVLNGSLTLAASVVLALQLRRSDQSQANQSQTA
jgi:heme A synthase